MNENLAPGLWRETVRVRVFETGPDGLLTPAALMNRLQDAAAVHATALSFGGPDLGPRGLAWVLVRLSLRIEGQVRAGETLDIRTWPCRPETRRAGRNFLVHSESGETLARAATDWMIIDAVKRAMVHIPPDLAVRVPEDVPPPLAVEAATPPRLAEAGHEALMHVRRADLDENGHANNVRYLEWALEALPDELIAGHRLVAADLSFRAEARRGQGVQSLCAVETDGEGFTAIHGLRRADDGRELARVLTSWTRKDG